MDRVHRKMIVGNGLLAQTFQRSNFNLNDVLIFASGVSNSKENSNLSFNRERILLQKAQLEYSNKLLIYFSSCALIDEKNFDIPYYKHKQQMEELVKEHKNYLIIRLPQIIGFSKNRNTILNFFIDKINKNEKLFLNINAYRYFVDIDDVCIFSNLLIKNNIKNITIDFANPYRYSVLEVVEIISKSLNKNYKNFEFIEGGEEYIINFENMQNILNRLNISFQFSIEYLKNNIERTYGAKSDAKI